MNLPAYLIALLSVIAVIIQAASLFLSLKLFRCPSDRRVLLKVVGLQTAFFAVIGLSTTFAPGTLAGLLNLIYFVGGVAVWFMLLKHFVANNYGFGKAISSYLVSYILSTFCSISNHRNSLFRTSVQNKRLQYGTGIDCRSNVFSL
jgi:hypothetical protein